MIRTGIVIWAPIWALAIVAGFAVVGASNAAADDPRERACQPEIDKAVRDAFPAGRQTGEPTVRPGIAGVRCPVVRPEYRIVNGKSELLPVDEVAAEAVLVDGRVVVVKVDLSQGATVAKVRSITSAHSDLVGSSGWGMALLFWLFALISVGGALFVVSRRNLIAAVMGMVGSFLGIAAVYMMLYAQFLAIVQMLVYAGAIMVLFVFVVMVLNRPEDEPVAPSGRAGQVLGSLAILFLVVRLIMILIRVEPPNAVLANAAPLSTAAGYDWGSVGAVGTDLFGPGLFPFEAISILLLVAVVGAIAIARPLHRGSNNAGDNPGDDADAGDDARPLGGGSVSTHPEGGAA